MKFTHQILRVSTLALVAFTYQVSAGKAAGATINEPAYNPATVVNVFGTVTSVRQVAPGNALAGTHLTVQTKTAKLDVYVAPPDFLKFLKASFKVGEEVEIIGSKVKFENADVILTRQLDDGFALITLRDPIGVADWQSWGKEIDPALVQ